MLNWYRKVVLPRLLNYEMGTEELKKIRREVLQDAAGTVLEIGAGPGYNLSIYKNIAKLYALEPSKELIGIAKGRAAGLAFPIEFLNSGAEQIPLPDRSIDTVVSTWTLCSVRDPKRVLVEISRVLKPQGKFLFIDHGCSPKTGRHISQILYTAVSKYFTGNCHYDRPIERIIRETGFHIEKMEHPTEGRFRPLVYTYKGIATWVRAIL